MTCKEAIVMQCSVADCGRRAVARGWCLMHYKRWRKHGAPDVVTRVRDPGRPCAVQGCARKFFCQRWCKLHYQRWAKYGDPLGAHAFAGSVTAAGYRQRFRPDHVLATRSGMLFEHREVLYAKIGPGAHPCHWCGRLVRWDIPVNRGGLALVTDHLNDSRLDNRPENLEPSCIRCNTKRGRDAVFERASG